jgi:hypothetical protein
MLRHIAGFGVAIAAISTIAAVAHQADSWTAPTAISPIVGGGSDAFGAVSRAQVFGGGWRWRSQLQRDRPGKERSLLSADIGTMERSVTAATIFFANGNDGQATIRYLDPRGIERFKAPDISGLTGAATQANVQAWLILILKLPRAQRTARSLCTFTGHGALNTANDDNNAMILWEEALMSVRDLATTLDQWPTATPFVTMMAQCYSGSFANLIYEGGDPSAADRVTESLRLFCHSENAALSGLYAPGQ